MLGPALVAVADLRDHVAIAQSRERACRLLAEHAADFDGVDHAHERREHGGLIPAAGADLQHAVGRLWLQFFGHVGHDERPRNSLRCADRQGHVEVGVGPLLGGQEFMPGHEPHAFEDTRIGHPAAGDVVADHLFAGFGKPINRRRRGPGPRRGHDSHRQPRGPHQPIRPPQRHPCPDHGFRLMSSPSHLDGRTFTNSISKISSSFGSMTGGDPSSP